MNKVNQKVELVANVLIVVVALLLIGIIVQRYFFSSPTAVNQPQRQEPTVGKKINLENVDFSAQPKTVVIALQTTCGYCNESAPFYKRLLKESEGKNIKFVAVFPTPEAESRKHLETLGITGFEVKQAPITALEASGTPTLILTNDKGEITNFWVGKLPVDKESEVINQLNS